MADRPGSYLPSQVCSPPDLPKYLKDVFDLKPIVGAPNDAEVIGILAVMHTARMALGIPRMHNPSLLMNLTDHLFNVQMARYRSKHSFIYFPSEATYTPPTLPAHVPFHLKPISGAPTDEEMIKVQDAVQTYQEMRKFPSMFDAHVNMELSQYLFDIQMARYMRFASESQQPPTPKQNAGTSRDVESTPQPSEEIDSATSNARLGANVTGELQQRQTVTSADISKLVEHSNRLDERFSQVLERFSQLIEQKNESTAQSDKLVDRFNQLFEQFNSLTEQSNKLAQQSTQSSYELVERYSQAIQMLSFPLTQSNDIAERLNQVLEDFNKPLQQSNAHFAKLVEQGSKHTEPLEEVMKDINQVLVGIQHAIIRGHKGNTASAVDCLVNKSGETLATSEITDRKTFSWTSKNFASRPGCKIPVVVGGNQEDLYVPESLLAEFLCFYDIGKGLVFQYWGEEGIHLQKGKENEARTRLSNYLTSCLG